MRTLYLVPRMYTVEEVQLILFQVPEDYSSKLDEFWSYVEDKLAVIKERVKHVYRDMVTRGGVEGLGYVKEVDERCYRVIEMLVRSGARLEVTEDANLVAEAESWVSLMKATGLRSAVMDLFKQNLEERNRFIAKAISETVKVDEIGVLFLEPTRRVELPEDFKVIKVCPFEPADYINSLIAKGQG
ncbi:MAG: hypothetical protein QXO32_02870 [Candidatus Bathyarchaeia archaeon]